VKLDTSASTNPFLAMLAAVDDGASQTEPYNNKMGTDKSADIKLPEFWPHPPALWFSRAECILRCATWKMK
jgi:hypothetical protein